MKVNIFQVGEKLFILNGKDPMRYIDLSTNKVVQYKQPRPKTKLKQKFWWLFPKKRKEVSTMQVILDRYFQKMSDSMIQNYFSEVIVDNGEFVEFPKIDGYHEIGKQPNVMNVLETTEARNMCMWYDGTIKPMRGHQGACGWKFDGQIWRHL